ncbi:MAG: hypothetical protein JWP89_6269 [Schlesneria sp.]|nr:hypothetical protein [Schlesneria sp.]
MAAFLPFLCFLPIMIACQDQPAEGSPMGWEYAALIYSVAMSFLLPLILVGRSTHVWRRGLRDALIFATAWLAMQFVMIFVLALISVALFGDGP